MDGPVYPAATETALSAVHAEQFCRRSITHGVHSKLFPDGRGRLSRTGSSVLS